MIKNYRIPHHQRQSEPPHALDATAGNTQRIHGPVFVSKKLQAVRAVEARASDGIHEVAQRQDAVARHDPVRLSVLDIRQMDDEHAGGIESGEVLQARSADIMSTEGRNGCGRLHFPGSKPESRS